MSLLELSACSSKSGLIRELEGTRRGRRSRANLIVPTAQPSPSFLRAPEAATGRRGWKEGRGKKEEKSGSSNNRPKRAAHG